MSEQSRKLFESLNDVREDFIEEAQEKPEKQKNTGSWLRWAAAAACICLLAGAAFLLRDQLWLLASGETGNQMAGGAMTETGEPGIAESSAAIQEVTGEAGGSEGRRWPVKIIEYNPLEGAVPASASAEGTPPPWEEMEIYDQYSAFIFDGRLYRANGPATIDPEKLEGEPVELTAFSYGGGQTPEDIDYTPEHQIPALVSHIRGVSAACAVAVQYEGTEEWYPARDRNFWDYTPQTLGQFIDDLNLRENLTFGTIYYTYWPGGEHAEVHFDSVDSEKIWELLLSNTEAENVCKDIPSGQLLDLFDPEEGEPDTILEISVSIPILGEENLALEVREDGYISTNLMGMTQKAFQIGEENTQAFVDYVLNECEGYEIRYVLPEKPHDEEEENDTSSTVSYIATPEGLIPADQFGSESQAEYYDAASQAAVPSIAETE